MFLLTLFFLPFMDPIALLKLATAVYDYLSVAHNMSAPNYGDVLGSYIIALLIAYILQTIMYDSDILVIGIGLVIDAYALIARLWTRLNAINWSAVLSSYCCLDTTDIILLSALASIGTLYVFDSPVVLDVVACVYALYQVMELIQKSGRALWAQLCSSLRVLPSMLSSAALRALKAVTPLAKDALRLICMVCSFTVSLIITMVRCVCHAAVILITSVVRVSLIYATTLFIEILVTAVLLNGYFLFEGILTPYKHRLAIASFALETIQRMFHLAVLWLPGLAVCAWELRKSITSTLSSFYHKYTRPTTAHMPIGLDGSRLLASQTGRHEDAVISTLGRGDARAALAPRFERTRYCSAYSMAGQSHQWQDSTCLRLASSRPTSDAPSALMASPYATSV
ncbi:hypothetical protein K466DRAFT_600129 [Polyporus arcularius HHB13444]|uniref:Uncharacterized protein n=1 Tax=Polyporus arcularius HHB13444 TaxID=1314778 RepID=A0A5C3PBS5_9APHY|nr:hypothetical protein K466DRAFT_600129 [Polyporus arcularius HHB13444]